MLLFIGVNVNEFMFTSAPPIIELEQNSPIFIRE